MKQGFVKVASATPEIKVADCTFNKNKIEALIRKAAEMKVKLLVLPELCVTGYTCADLFYDSALLEKAYRTVSDIKRDTAGLNIISVVGAPFVYLNKIYNCAFVLYKGKTLGIIPKKVLPNYGEFSEKRYFVEGFNKAKEIAFDNEKVLFGTDLIFSCIELPEFKFGIEICEDLWSIDSPSNRHAQAGANIICNLSASNELVGKQLSRKNLILIQSSKLISAYVYANAGMGESTGDAVFSSHNVIAENGKLLNESIWKENELLISEIDVFALKAERIIHSRFFNKYIEEYTYVDFSMIKETTLLTRSYNPYPFVGAEENQKERFEKVLTIQSMGLAKRIKHTNCQKAVIGISGGLDSALALLVTVRAMDFLGRKREDIICVSMPCFGTTKRTKTNAQVLSENLGVTFREIDISKSVSQHFEDIGQDKENYDVTFENSQARERTQVLMDIANMENGMVIGTGDLSELVLGFATYNGDHMSMYGVNASVPKTLVRHLVRYEANKIEDAGVKFSLNDILETPVSPELVPPKDGEISQKTEGIVGPYELHDFFLYYLLRYHFSPTKIFRLAIYAFSAAYDRTTILSWLKMFYRRFFAQQFKRSCLPDGLKVGSVSVSPRGDLKMPSDAEYTIWKEELEKLK